MKQLLGLTAILLLAFPSLILANTAKPLVPIHMCVWDPIGNEGPGNQAMKEGKLQAFKWGIDLTFDIYSEERVAIEEFKLGRCDMVNLLGFRVREFNSLTGSLDAVGAIPSYDHLGIVIKSLSSKKAAKLMKVGEYEVMGIGPAGAIFMFTRDRSILRPTGFAGKKMAVLDEIPESSYLSKKYGVTPVNSTIFNSFLKFNNGQVDLTAAPAVAYEPFEMYKGLEPNGGIYRDPFMYITMQIVGRSDKFPEGVPQMGREYALENYPRFVNYLKEPEATIPEDYWIDVPQESYDFWVEDFRSSRLELADMGIYDRRALKLMRKVRCKKEPDLAECTAKVKE